MRLESMGVFQTVARASLVDEGVPRRTHDTKIARGFESLFFCRRTENVLKTNAAGFRGVVVRCSVRRRWEFADPPHHRPGPQVRLFCGRAL